MIRKSFPPTLCRLCGLIKSQGTDVCSTSAKRTGILVKINKRLSKEVIHIAVGDGLPKFVCSDCEIVINDFAEFCKMVHEVQKRLEDERVGIEEAAEDKTTTDMTNTFGGIRLKAPETSCNGREENGATVSIGPDGKVECKLCQSYLEAVEHTTLHMVTHGIGTIICRCRVCGHRAELAQFLRSAGDKSSVWCDACGFVPVAEKPKAHVCEICSKAFRSKAHLSRHRIVHSGAKPFLCEVCGTGFGQKSSLKLHVLSHTGLNPHKCEHCGQAFRFKDSLRSHVMSLHWPVSDAAADQTVYQCDQCDRQFATVYKLRRHYRSHTGERPYECDRCGRLFSQTCNLKLHRKKHEEEDARNNEQYGSSLLVPQQPDPTLLVDSILPHPVVPCGDLDSTIDTVLLRSGEKNPDHAAPYVSLSTQYLAGDFGHDGLLYMDQAANLPDTSPNEGVALPTFSSLQPVSSVSLSNLTH